MTRPVWLILTVSLDGFIADPAGGVDWLADMPAEPPEDYLRIIEGIDTLIMGRDTYLVSLALEGGTDIFDGRDVHVFTSRTDLPEYPGARFVNEPAEDYTRRLADSEGGGIWLFGGGKLATALVDAGLVDEYLIAVQPILLGDGIPLWRTPHARTALELLSTQAWPGGVVELRYRRAQP